VTHLDPSVCRALNGRDLPVLEALREDRDNSGPGISRATVERLGATRHPDPLITRLRKQGHVVGVVGDLYQLGEEPDAESCHGDSRDAAFAPEASSLSECATSVAALSPEPLSLFPSGSSHYTMDEAA
jgi:hypothetical protein